MSLCLLRREIDIIVPIVFIVSIISIISIITIPPILSISPIAPIGEYFIYQFLSIVFHTAKVFINFAIENNNQKEE